MHIVVIILGGIAFVLRGILLVKCSSVHPARLCQTPRLLISIKSADPPVYSTPPLYSGLESTLHFPSLWLN